MWMGWGFSGGEYGKLTEKLTHVKLGMCRSTCKCREKTNVAEGQRLTWGTA